MNESFEKTPLRDTFIGFAIVVVMLSGYLLSYAPAKRYGMTRHYTTRQAFRPVEWLMDETTIGKPLVVWAESWGAMTTKTQLRQIVRDAERLGSAFPRGAWERGLAWEREQ